MVVDRNRVDVEVESGPLHYSPRRGIGRSAEMNLLGSMAANMAARWGFLQDGREKRADVFVILTGAGEFVAEGGGFEAGGGGFKAGGGGFAAGGRGHIEGLPSGGSKARLHFLIGENRFQLTSWIGV